MLWRGSARLGGVSGVDFNVLGNPAELVRKLKVNTDIAVFVNLDMVYQLNERTAEPYGSACRTYIHTFRRYHICIKT